MRESKRAPELYCIARCAATYAAWAVLCGVVGCGAHDVASPSSAPLAGNGNGGETASAVVQGEVVAELPHRTDAFTQGLEFHGGVLYESTGLIGHSSLRVVEPSTGRVLRTRDLAPELYAEGLTLMNGRVYQLTLRAGRCLVYDAQSLAQVAEHRYEGEGWGLSHDETSLIMSDGSEVLRFLDPTSFTETRRVVVTDAGTSVTGLNELEMVEGELYANVWRSDRIARIDPADGRVVGWIDLALLSERVALTEPEAVLNGIAYDAGSRRLLVTGKFWPLVFEIRVPR